VSLSLRAALLAHEGEGDARRRLRVQRAEQPPLAVEVVGQLVGAIEFAGGDGGVGLVTQLGDARLSPRAPSCSAVVCWAVCLASGDRRSRTCVDSR